MNLRRTLALPTTAPRASWRQSRRVRRVATNTVTIIILTAGALMVAFPFFWEISTGFKAPADVYRWPPLWIPWPLHAQNFKIVADVVPLGLYIKNSVTIVLLVIIGTEISCSMAAYAFARLRFPGRDILFMITISTMIIPPAATMVPQFVIFQKIGWYNTFYPLIVPAFFGNAFFIFLLRQFFLSMSPEMEDAARIDGAGFFVTFFLIILPLSRPALATVAIFSFVWTWNDFFGPLIYLSDQDKFTLPLGLVFFQGAPHSPAQIQLLMAMSLIIVVPCVLLYFFAQRIFIQGIVFTGVKG